MITAVDITSSNSPYVTRDYILVLLVLSSLLSSFSTSDGNYKDVKEEIKGVQVSHTNDGWTIRKGGRVEEDGAELKSGIIIQDQD